MGRAIGPEISHSDDASTDGINLCSHGCILSQDQSLSRIYNKAANP